MKNQLTFLVVLAVIVTTSLCGCSNTNGNTTDPVSSSSIENTLAPNMKASNQPNKVSLPQVEKIEKIKDFNGSYWISDDEILGFGNPLSPKPKGPNITYPDRPVQVYNTLDKSKKSFAPLVMTRFEDMGLISPDKKNVFWLSKSWGWAMLNIKTKQVTKLKNTEPFLSYHAVWLNNNEFLYIAEESNTVHKYNMNGIDTRIRKLDKYFESLFMLRDRIYLIEAFDSANNSKKVVYYTDPHFSEIHNLGEFNGNVSFVGNEIILNKINSSSESTQADSASMSANSSTVRLDKDFKEKDTLIDENIMAIDLKENTILYLKNAGNKVGLYSMDATSRKTVELYSSSELTDKYDRLSFAINTSRKKLFLSFVNDNETMKAERYETVLITLK